MIGPPTNRPDGCQYGDMRGIPKVLAVEKGWIERRAKKDPRPCVVITLFVKGILIVEGRGCNPRKRVGARRWSQDQERRLIFFKMGDSGHTKCTWYWLIKKRLHQLPSDDVDRLEPWRCPRLSVERRDQFAAARSASPYALRVWSIQQPEEPRGLA